jgi:hypothetical protein
VQKHASFWLVVRMLLLGLENCVVVVFFCFGWVGGGWGFWGEEQKAFAWGDKLLFWLTRFFVYCL